MTKMNEAVRQMVGLENLLGKARRRYRECEREALPKRADVYRLAIKRISDELHSADNARLAEYLQYMESDLLPRMGNRVSETLEGMVQAGLQVVEGRHHLMELRSEYSDALDRIRSVRERLGKDPFKPVDIRFGPGMPPPHADRAHKDAHDLVKGYLKA